MESEADLRRYLGSRSHSNNLTPPFDEVLDATPLTVRQATKSGKEDCHEPPYILRRPSNPLTPSTLLKIRSTLEALPELTVIFGDGRRTFARQFLQLIMKCCV